MGDAPFTVIVPQKPRSGVALASPHSGRLYPDSMCARTLLDSSQLRSSEDAFVDQLLSRAPEFGAPLLCAKYARAYVDLNRASDELDPALIEGLRPRTLNPRVAAGLGVVPRVVAGGRAIYSGKISLAEAQARISQVWLPYHRQLYAMMEAAHRKFGQAILLDMHSMPHEALYHSLHPAPQIVIGDRFGASAAAHVTNAVKAAFTAQGFRVAHNMPFAGAFVADTYGKPAKGWHVVQIEIDRSLYMDEAKIIPNSAFSHIKHAVSAAIDAVIALSELPNRHAAE